MRIIKYTLLLACLLFLMPSVGIAQSIDSRADKLLSAYHQQDLFTGTVLIAKKGNIVFERSYGMANREQSIPNSSDTEYRIGSISKPVTALIIIHLQQNQKLDFTDTIGKYFRSFPKGDSVTIENLLNHTSGIRSITSTEKYRKAREELQSREDVIGLLRKEPFVFSPGSSWQYSNSNYILLSYIAETVSGKTMQQLVMEFTTSIGMNNSGMDYDGRLSHRKALGYEETGVQDYVPVADNNIDLLTGAGGMYSTARDLYLLLSSMDSDLLVSMENKTKMFQPGKGQYGYGWEIENFKGRPGYGHSGSIEGFKAQILNYPDSGVYIIFLSNYFNTRGPEICEGLKAIAFNEPSQLPAVKNFIGISDPELKKYEGEYTFKGTIPMTIKVSSGRILSIIKGQPIVGFRPVSSLEFYNKSNNAVIHFEKDSSGSISGFRLLKGKQEMQWERVMAN